MHRLPIAAATLFCSGALVAACSSSAHPPAAGAPAGTAMRAPARMPEPRTAHDRKAPPATNGGGVAAFCTLISKNNAILTDIAAGDDARGGVDTTRLLHDMDLAVARAPLEIRKDMRVVVDFDRQVFARHTEIKETPQLDAALQHYAAWIGAHCTGRRS